MRSGMGVGVVLRAGRTGRDVRKRAHPINWDEDSIGQ